MKIGTVFDYDPQTNTWVTITDPEQAWLVALIHTLRSEPAQHPFYADHGVSSLNALQNNVLPTSDVLRTQQQFAPYFKKLVITPSISEPVYQIDYEFFSGAKPDSRIVDLSKYK